MRFTSRSPLDGDTGIGNKQIDLAAGFLRDRDGILDIALSGNIAANGRAIQFASQFACRIFVDVGNDDMASPVPHQGPANGPPDSLCSAGDDGNPMANVHGDPHIPQIG
jgi:hypothetical protein